MMYKDIDVQASERSTEDSVHRQELRAANKPLKWQMYLMYMKYCKAVYRISLQTRKSIIV